MRVTSPVAQILPIRAPNRLEGLDTLRGLAAVFVLLLHAGIPYMVVPIPHIAWPARDPHPSAIVDGLTWCSECFLMCLFFLMAGFFSQAMIRSQGAAQFLAGRTNRLLKPQIAAGFAVLPVLLVIWSLGWVADGIYVPENIMNKGLPPEIEADVYGVAHLWFMQNLYIYSLILFGIQTWLSRPRSEDSAVARFQGTFGRMVDRIVSSAWKPLLPAIPCALILYFDPRVVLGFYQGYIPALTKLAYYCIYFFVGTALNRHSESVHNHGRHGIKYLAVAGILFAVMLPQIHECVTQGMTDSRLAVLCGMMALFGATTTFGLFALFLGTIQRGNAITRYLAEASFWVYLVHLPFVGLTHIALAQTSMPTIAKFCIAGITALGLSLASYQVFVRRTSLGAFLNGTRPKSAAATETSQPAITPTPLKVSA